jgi:hypothetical protein
VRVTVAGPAAQLEVVEVVVVAGVAVLVMYLQSFCSGTDDADSVALPDEFADPTPGPA